jgi:hypothetical protein
MLTYAETLTSEIFMDQSDTQLEYTLKGLLDNEDAFDVVEFILTSKEQLGFVVGRDFYVNALLNELAFRGKVKCFNR